MKWSRRRLALFRVDGVEAERVERVLAIARAVIAGATALAIYIDRGEPYFSSGAATALIAGYIAYSIAVLTLARRLPENLLRFRALIHLFDLVWIGALIFVTGGSASPFFSFSIFVIVAAAYRWSWDETILTGALAAVLLAGQGIVMHSDIDRFIIRVVYVILTSILLGYLAESDKRLRDENALIARAMSKARPEAGLSESVERVCDDIRLFFRAERVMMFVEEIETGRLFAMGRSRANLPPEHLRVLELDPTERRFYLFPMKGDAWFTHRQAKSGGYDTRSITREGSWVPPSDAPYPQEFSEKYTFATLFAAALSFGDELAGRLYIFDPELHSGLLDELRFLRRLVEMVTPSLYNVYLWRRFKAKAGAIERAQVARELHDGVIQSLIGLEMQLEVLKQESESGKTPNTLNVAHIQDLLRNEIQNVRELMAQMRPLNLNPAELVNFISEQVNKFSRETGISAKFLADTDEVALPPKVCRELTRIVQEALVNVRKHSRAEHVMVTLKSQGGFWDLSIVDDGRGFDFAGKLSQSDLDRQHRGPIVIKERVRLINGQLEIESKPGQGARLDVRLPKNYAYNTDFDS